MLAKAANNYIRERQHESTSSVHKSTDPAPDEDLYELPKKINNPRAAIGTMNRASDDERDSDPSSSGQSEAPSDNKNDESIRDDLAARRAQFLQQKQQMQNLSYDPMAMSQKKGEDSVGDGLTKRSNNLPGTVSARKNLTPPKNKSKSKSPDARPLWSFTEKTNKRRNKPGRTGTKKKPKRKNKRSIDTIVEDHDTVSD